MSDRHNGGNVPPDDLYRYSGGGNGNDGGQGDLYRYSGTNINQRIFRRTDGQDPGSNPGNDGSSDPFANDRMPGRDRRSEFPENIQQRFMTSDGTLIINNVHCKNAFFNQTPIDGADFRRDPRMDFRQYDPNARNLRQRDQSSYYSGNGDNGGFDPNQDTSYSRRRSGSDSYYQDPGRQAAMDQQRRAMDEERCREMCAAQLREQMYRRSCEHVRDANPNYSNQPYYDNQGYYPRPCRPNVGHNRPDYDDNGGYPNRGYNRPDYSSGGYPNRGYNRPDYDDNGGYPNRGYNRGGVGVDVGISTGGGSPCFGRDRTRVSASVRLPNGIRIGGDFNPGF